MKKIITILSVSLLAVAFAGSAAAGTTQNAVYDSHTGNIYPSSGAIADAVATPDDGLFVQMGPGSTITLKFPGDYVAAPDGSSAADLRVDIFDAAFQADAEVYVSLDGSTWTSVGNYPDTANIDLDIEGTGPAKYVKIDQNGYYIDPAYPNLGFDLDAVVALNAKVDADGDGYVSDVDCNDADAAINPGATEVCDGVDNDCDVATLDGSRETTLLNTKQLGVCSGSLQVCTAGSWTDDYAGVTGYENPEVSCDTLDNDCDGTTDQNVCPWYCASTNNDMITMTGLALGTNRWIYNPTSTYPDNFVTVLPKGKGSLKGYTLESTNYCSCSQILNQLREYNPALYGNMEGHWKYGCSISVMNEFIRLIKPGVGTMTGQWLLSVNGGAYMHDMFILTQNPDGTLTGKGGYPAGSGPIYPYPYNWTLAGQLTGSAITMTTSYQNGYTATISGIVDPSWNSMSGGAGTGGVTSWSATRI